MRKRTLFGVPLTAVMLVGLAAAAEPLKSGPQVGSSIGAFNPLHVTGAGAGAKSCLV